MHHISEETDISGGSKTGPITTITLVETFQAFRLHMKTVIEERTIFLFFY